MLGDSDKIRYQVYDLLFHEEYAVNYMDVNALLDVLGLAKIEGTDQDGIAVTKTGFSILTAVIIGVAGFLFMYFSSMIILVLHGIRYLFFSPLEKHEVKTNAEAQNTGAPGVKVSFYVGAGILFVLLVFFIVLEGSKGLNHFLSITIVIVVAFLIVMSSSAVKEFYDRLSMYRVTGYAQKESQTWLARLQNTMNSRTTYKANEASDYVESYKHLREHGNAFGIIVCEILFAAWLIKWEFSFWAIVYWCLIGFFPWVLGTYLEVRKTFR